MKRAACIPVRAVICVAVCNNKTIASQIAARTKLRLSNVARSLGGNHIQR